MEIFQKPEEDRSPLETVTKRLVKTRLTKKEKCVLQCFKICEIAIELELLVVTSYKTKVNTVTNPNHVYCITYQ
jgi:hypothetical protein